SRLVYRKNTHVSQAERATWVAFLWGTIGTTAERLQHHGYTESAAARFGRRSIAFCTSTGEVTMKRMNSLVVLTAGCLAASAMLLPSVGYTQEDPRVAKSMETLKTMTAKLGTPKLEGNEAVGGKDAPVLYFGTTKINNNFDIVDAVGKEDG